MQGETIRAVVTESERPLTIDEIHAQACQRHAGLGLATVYRAVQRLTEEGAVQSLSFPGEDHVYYEPHRRKEHDHFLCLQCDRAFCISGIPVMWERMVPRGFQYQDHQVTLTGLCKDCKTTKQT